MQLRSSVLTVSMDLSAATKPVSYTILRCDGSIQHSVLLWHNVVFMVDESGCRADIDGRHGISGAGELATDEAVAATSGGVLNDDLWHDGHDSVYRNCKVDATAPALHTWATGRQLKHM